VFGYASLIWPGRRSGAMRWCTAPRAAHAFRVNRGTPGSPGWCLHCRGGSCRVVYACHDRAHDELDRLWARNAHRRVRPALAALPHQGPVRASSARAAGLPACPADAQMLHLLRQGRYGTTLDYLSETARWRKCARPQIER
jgi:cation transport regulator ChaC